MYYSLELDIAPDKRIDLARQNLRIEIQRILFQHTLIAGWLFGFVVSVRLRGATGFAFRDAMHNIIYHIKAADTAFGEEMHRMGIFFAE